MSGAFDFVDNCRKRLNLEKCRKVIQRSDGIPGSKKIEELFSIFELGYTAAFETEPERLVKQIADIPPITRRAILEGAFAGLASQDLSDTGNWLRIKQFEKIAPDSTISMYVGIGGALSHMRVPADVHTEVADAFWGWFSLDGYGFHEGYFRWWDYIEKQRIPPNLDNLAREAFDHGIGRAIWFISVANPEIIRSIVERFPPKRRPQLWSGIGIQTGLFGLHDADDLRKLLKYSGKFRASLQQGVAFGVHARVDVDDMLDSSEGACQLICEADVAEVREVTTTCFSTIQHLPLNAHTFLKWKVEIESAFAAV